MRNRTVVGVTYAPYGMRPVNSGTVGWYWKTTTYADGRTQTVPVKLPCPPAAPTKPTEADA